MIVVCDFDGTLAIGDYHYITAAKPNLLLISRLRSLKKETNAYIKVVTARGSKRGLSIEEKKQTYETLIKEFLNKWDVPYDEISFNKEYADLYIDDMTISQNSNFTSFISPFTKNEFIETETTFIKKSKSAPHEKEWYNLAKNDFNTPKVLFCNDDTIITEKIKNSKKPSLDDFINLIEKFKNKKIENYEFETYKQNLILHKECTQKTINVVSNLTKHKGTFFHGDLSTHNVLKVGKKIYLIDPNYKGVFGSWKTDLGKAIFSFVAYESDWSSAEKLIKHFGDWSIEWAVAEGLRVVKFKPHFISIVNNLADEIK